MESNIILIGFMGSGKTSVGKELSKLLQMEFLDTDSMIEHSQGMTINEIFQKHGETFFRELETKTAKEVGTFDNKVISTGGGIVLKEENLIALKKKGLVTLLWAKPETVYSRLKDKKDRPLLNVPDPVAKINELLTYREPFYKKHADIVIETDKLDIYQIVLKIKEAYLKR